MLKKSFIKKVLSLLAIGALIVPIVASALVVYPTGRATDGDLTFSSTRTEDTTKSNITVATNSSYASTTVASVSGFVVGEYVLISEPQGIGNYEVKKISEISGSDILYSEALLHSYAASGAQVT